MRSHPFTFRTLLFAFLLLLPLVEHDGGLGSLLQFGHEALDVIEAVIEDVLDERGSCSFNT